MEKSCIRTEAKLRAQIDKFFSGIEKAPFEETTKEAAKAVGGGHAVYHSYPGDTLFSHPPLRTPEEGWVLYRRIQELTDGTFTEDFVDSEANDHIAFAWLVHKGVRNGKPFNYPYIRVWKLDGNGEATESFGLPHLDFYSVWAKP